MSIEKKLKKTLISNNYDAINNTFEEIYNEYSKLVYFTIMKYVDNAMDIEDLVQETFTDFFNKIKSNEINNIKYYLLVAAKNKCINFNKKQGNYLFIYDDKIIFSKEENLVNKDYIYILNEIKSFINDFELEIIVNHVIYDLPFRELASIYNRPINSILSTYHRGIKKIKKGLMKNEN